VKAEDAFDLSGNPAIDQLWPTYQLKYLENGREKSMEVSMTFADFALTEARFRKHFRKVPRDAWNDNMALLVEFLQMSEEEREGKFPFIWAVDRKQQLSRVLISKTIVESCEERRDFWIMLKGLAGIKPAKVEEVDIEGRIRAEVVGKITQGLMKLAGGDGQGIVDLAISQPTAEAKSDKTQNEGDFLAPWLETDECTSCDECTKLNSKIFAYNSSKKAFIKDPEGGPYEDLVKAAEKCPARIIHPGTPADRGQKDIEKWIKRGEKYN
jgi:pyruvate-ferredoxin/flavodoxin oxidoreductase